MNFLAQKRSKILLKETQKVSSGNGLFDDFYYKEVAKLTNSGGWRLDLDDHIIQFDVQARKILNISEEKLALTSLIRNHFPDDFRERAEQLYYNCAEGIPFVSQIRILNGSGVPFWAKLVGRPIYKDRIITGMHGVLQHIETEKIKELELLKCRKIVETQQSSLQNFTNIVSHGLRSHASNLHLSLELLRTADSEDDRNELIENLFKISENIGDTVGHISEFATIRKASDEKEPVIFNNVLQQVKNTLHHTISDAQAEIYSDFSEVPEMEYIPSYLESIFMTLITNAIKFSSKDRSPVIEIYTYFENDDVCLMIRDNGMGIDLEKNGKRIFNIYQTFHAVKDSVGVGLFLLKNKIEKLQGTINVCSTVDEGTTFTIRF